MIWTVYTCMTQGIPRTKAAPHTARTKSSFLLKNFNRCWSNWSMRLVTITSTIANWKDRTDSGVVWIHIITVYCGLSGYSGTVLSNEVPRCLIRGKAAWRRTSQPRAGTLACWQRLVGKQYKPGLDLHKHTGCQCGIADWLKKWMLTLPKNNINTIVKIEKQEIILDKIRVIFTRVCINVPNIIISTQL